MIVTENERCLVYRKGAYRGVFLPGTHRKPFGATLEHYYVDQEFLPSPGLLSWL